MQRNRTSAWFVTLALLAACGSDRSGGGTTATANATTTTSAPPTTTRPAPVTTQPAVTTTTAPPAPTTTTQPAPTTTEVVPVEPAIWPASDVVFDTPEAAAADFVTKVLGEGPVLGAFRAGDLRSGEIDVFASVDGAPIGLARSVLQLRRLGPSDGWFVLAAVSDQETITAPQSMAHVPAGPLTIEGVATGFEATVVVSAFVAGGAELDKTVTMAGNFGATLPYSVSLDLSGAQPGDVVGLMVRGGAGLETDPGDFAAIPVVIGN